MPNPPVHAPSPDSARLLEMLHASWMAPALCVAADLRLPEHLAGGPRSAEELGKATGAHAASLERLLLALCTLGVIRRLPEGRFEVTPLGALLGEGAPGSLRHWVLWWGGALWPLWGHLGASVRTGQSARRLLSGTRGFEHLARDERAAATFHLALAELTRLSVGAVVAAYDFTGLARVVDVGGGYGELLAAILHAAPRARGVLLDLPHALEGARRHLDEQGVGPRCELVGGDFFEAVPPGGDAYILKSVIHDWDDQRARLILRSCRRAMQETAGAAGAGEPRLLLIEQVLPDDRAPTPRDRSLSRSDLNMLVAHGSGERSEAQLRALLAGADLRVRRIVPTASTFSVIEATAGASPPP